MLKDNIDNFVVEVRISGLHLAEVAQTTLLEHLSAFAWDFNCQGVAEPAGKNLPLRAWFPTEKDAEAFVDTIERGGDWTFGVIVNCSVEREEKVDWVANWRHHFHPVLIGQNFLISPPWEADSVRMKHPGRAIIQIEPGMAFGTGTHETTQLCLEMAEAHLKPGIRVLDIGTGSGILLIASLLLGVDHATGIEVDPDAEENFRYNVALNVPNPIIGEKVEFLLSDGLTSLNKLDFDIIFANMLSHRVERIFEQASSLSAMAGDLQNTLWICSGILMEEWSVLREKWESKFRLKIEEEKQSGEWMGFTARIS